MISPEEERQELKRKRVRKGKLIKQCNVNKDAKREAKEEGKENGEKRSRNTHKEKSMLVFSNASPDGNGINNNRTSELHNNK